jgi:hypothetical protein
MTILTIKFESTDAKFVTKIDKLPHDYVVHDNTITIDADISHGFHTLEITVQQPTKFIDVEINGVSVKHTLYLGYIDDQLTTEVKQGTWVLPFGNPVSWWLAECNTKFPNNVYGTDLNASYNIYYPQSIILGNQYPKVLRDFFEYNLSFHAHTKDLDPRHSTEVPFVALNIEYDEAQLLEEFDRNLSLIEQHAYKPKQVTADQPKPWQVAMAIYPGTDTATISEQDFPEFFKLLSSIKGIEVGWAFIGALEPGSYVLPHIDDLYAYIDSVKDCVGCCQIYIPIGWKKGNYFKFDSAGLVPFDRGAILAGTTDFTHASVNDSDSIRYTIGIICKTMTDEFKQYL